MEGSTPWEGLHLTKDTVEVPIDGGLAWAVKSSSGNVIGVAMKWTPPPPAEEEESGGAPADVAAVPGQQPQVCYELFILGDMGRLSHVQVAYDVMHACNITQRPPDAHTEHVHISKSLEHS